jgi:hypothetical protein
VEKYRTNCSYNITLLELTDMKWMQCGHMRLATGELLLYSGHGDEDAAYAGRSHRDVERSTKSSDIMGSTRPMGDYNKPHS